jgi:hypothetical protein
LDGWDQKFEYLVAIIDQAPESDLDYLGGIGAGPLEDLSDLHILSLISDLRDRGIERESGFDKKLCLALQMFRMQPCGKAMTEAEKTIIKYIKYHYPSFVDDGEFHTI